MIALYSPNASPITLWKRVINERAIAYHRVRSFTGGDKEAQSFRPIVSRHSRS